MTRNSDNQPTTTIERVNQYETLKPLLEAILRDFAEFSKKKPEGVLNKSKVAMINRLLKDILILLDDEPTRRYLDLLDEDELPQNSDVLLMLNQVNAAMRTFYIRFHSPDDLDDLISTSEWVTE